MNSNNIQVADDAFHGYYVPRGIEDEVNRKFKQWETRRGFVSNSISTLSPEIKLRGAAARSVRKKNRKSN